MILMEESVAELPGKFVLNALGFSLSAEGTVALALALPVALVLAAIAYRIAKR
jgi:hypothetical protein